MCKAIMGMLKESRCGLCHLRVEKEPVVGEWLMWAGHCTEQIPVLSVPCVPLDVQLLRSGASFGLSGSNPNTFLRNELAHSVQGRARVRGL